MKKVALFVGVDRYEDQSIATLGCAARDARELGWVFRDRLGFTVEVLTDAELGSGSNVMSTLRKMGKELSAGDTFVFYFSGHGKSVGDRDQLFLLPHADAASVESGSTGEGTLSYTQLLRFTTSWVGVRRGFIFDACRSPLEIKKDGGPAQFEGEVVYRDFNLASSVGNTSSPFVILNSCHDQERAEELKGYEGGHGLFSAALLETFKHQAQLRKPVVIDEDLAHTVGESMRQLAIRYGGRETKQQPLFVGHGAKDLRLFGMEDQQNQQVQGLLADFEQQLSQGKLERPVGDNCRDTLNRLAALGCASEELQGLSIRLEAALEDQTLQRCLQNDEQRIVAARLAGTMEAYAQYLATCEDCAHREEAELAIWELKEESSRNRQEEERLRQEAAEQAKRQAEQQEAERQSAKEEEAARIAQEKARLKKERDEAKVLAAAAEKRKQEEAERQSAKEQEAARIAQEKAWMKKERDEAKVLAAAAEKREQEEAASVQKLEEQKTGSFWWQKMIGIVVIYFVVAGVVRVCSKTSEPADLAPPVEQAAPAVPEAAPLPAAPPLTKPHAAENARESVEAAVANKPATEDPLIDKRYRDNGDGTATDITTGLQWMRCSLGQTWDGNTCVGEGSDLHWDQAMSQAKGFHFAGYSDWRLPTQDELNDIVYCSTARGAFTREWGKSKGRIEGGTCEGNGYQKPTINHKAFPNSVSSWYLSSLTHAGDRNRAWGINFSNGFISYDHKEIGGYVRLVRASARQ